MKDPLEVTCPICESGPGEKCNARRAGPKAKKPKIGHHAARTDVALGTTRPKRMGRMVKASRRKFKG